MNVIPIPVTMAAPVQMLLLSTPVNVLLDTLDQTVRPVSNVWYCLTMFEWNATLLIFGMKDDRNKNSCSRFVC